MKTVVNAAELREVVAGWRRDNLRIALVPTMGALHAGHLSLVDAARRHADRVVVSIFVNPTQFGPEEDLDLYPRTPSEDARRLAETGCDLLFLPTPEVLYPPGHSVTVEPGTAAEGLEGEHRPGHFRGVATVVTLLFNLAQPDVAVFGRKDAQQLAVIEQLVRDLHLPITIVAGETVREDDGLAMSSRNRYLDAAERRAATVLWRSLSGAQRLIAAGERDADLVRARLLEVLTSEPLVRVDYVEVVDTQTFRPVLEITAPVVVPIAVFLGTTRLIDNLALAPASAE
ncbi:MAG: pantoate--beta-alanine ligase [Thermoanaerobaculia bacterium]|nr:pantoate--beta-alanine ligase [Thermoanaerobaculia bacterium]